MASLPAAALLAGLLLVASVGAQPQAQWEERERTLAFQSQPGGFQFTSLGPGSPQDRLAGEFDASAAEFALDFASQDPAAPAAFHLETVWTALVEYRDLDGDGSYGLRDQAVRRVELADLDGAVLATPLVGGGHAATVTYAVPANESGGPLPVEDGLPTQDGRLQILFRVVPEPAAAAAGRDAQLPTEVQAGVLVEDFPFQADDTALALEMSVVTAAGSSLQAAASGAGVEVASGAYGAAFALDPTAAVPGGTVVAPVSQVSAGDQATTLLVSWPRSDSVRQDGGFAVRHAPANAIVDFVRDPPGNPWAYAAGLAVAAVALGAPSLRRLRGA